MAVRDDFAAGEVLAAADLNDTFAAKADTTGNGAWTAYTPSTSGLTIGNGTLTAAYVRMGKTVHGFAFFTFGSTSAVTGNIVVPLPTTAVAGSIMMTAWAQDTGVAGYPMTCDLAGSAMYFRAISAGGTYAGQTNTSSTVPFTWNATDLFRIQFTYQEA